MSPISKPLTSTPPKMVRWTFYTLMLLFTRIIETYQVQPEADGPASPLRDISLLYPKPEDFTINKPRILKGQSIAFYLRFLRNSEGNIQNVYTAAFFPHVDDYSTLSVPSSYSLLNTFASSNVYTNLSMVMYLSGAYYETEWRQWTHHTFGVTYYVPSRTVLVTSLNGSLLVNL